jgi:hypothetical protein
VRGGISGATLKYAKGANTEGEQINQFTTEKHRVIEVIGKKCYNKKNEINC